MIKNLKLNGQKKMLLSKKDKKLNTFDNFKQINIYKLNQIYP